ncbi:MAG: protein kinase [Deltaproteobacteria bacterium]|nr:protein kinase [Deltaproteobacteria bacterium]
MQLAPGTAIDRYTVEAPIGRGGMAVVYRVRHNQLGSMHALKVLTLPTDTIRARLLQEGRIQSQFNHPNLVNVTDVVEVEGSPGLVMEYVDGGPVPRWAAPRPGAGRPSGPRHPGGSCGRP